MTDKTVKACSCGKLATAGRYKRQGEPLCPTCYYHAAHPGKTRRGESCACGHPADAGRYRRQGEPLCKRCYQQAERDAGTKSRPTRAYVAAAKDVPCTDCGGRFPKVCMDFDHVRGEKLFNLGSRVSADLALEVLAAEIAKCDVVCSNCHRIRTLRRWEERRAGRDD